jgi:hypothetical protein
MRMLDRKLAANPARWRAAKESLVVISPYLLRPLRSLAEVLQERMARADASQAMDAGEDERRPAGTVVRFPQFSRASNDQSE